MTKEEITIKFSREKIQEIMKDLNSVIDELSGKCEDKEMKTLKELIVLFRDSLWDKELELVKA